MSIVPSVTDSGESDEDDLLPPLYRSLEDEPPDGMRPFEYYPPCAFCHGFVRPREDHHVPVCGECGTDVDGILVDGDEVPETNTTALGLVAARNEERPRYSQSETVIQAGGFEQAYEDDHLRRDTDDFLDVG